MRSDWRGTEQTSTKCLKGGWRLLAFRLHYTLWMFLLLSLFIKASSLAGKCNVSGVNKLPASSRTAEEAKLIFSITHSKCWSDGNAARISTSFRNPWWPHTGPSLEENKCRHVVFFFTCSETSKFRNFKVLNWARCEEQEKNEEPDESSPSHCSN